MDDYNVMGLAAIAEINYLRLEAMELFERCLTEGRTTLLEAFLEHQITRDPPPLELLREIADDLHQRLTALREYHADVLDRVWSALTEDFGLRSGSGTAGDLLREIENLLHHLDSPEFSLTANETVLLRKMLDTSMETALQLQDDVLMTEQLHRYLLDWVNALNATVARRFWVNGRGDKYSNGIQ